MQIRWFCCRGACGPHCSSEYDDSERTPNFRFGGKSAAEGADRFGNTLGVSDMNQVTKRDKPRLIQGVILKCVDGRWTDGDGLAPPSEMLVIGITHALQCWGKDKDLLDTIIEQPGEELPDVDALNAQIPEEEWGVGFDNKPRAPWAFNWVVYLLDPESASTYTFINSTAGARIATERLEDRIKWMRTLRGNDVAPIVQLKSRPMKTGHAGVVKQRPEFTVIEWRDLNVKPAAPQIEHKAETVAEPAPKKVKVGKLVKPTTIAEEIDDGIPDFGIKE
jgi:hypothetical protein